MKLLVSMDAWKLWVTQEDGQAGCLDHSPPRRFPCYAYMEVESRSQGTLSPVYLYQRDLDEMSLELLAFAQRM